MNIFRNLVKTTDLTIILVTHDPKVAEGANRRIILEDGRIV
jgi:ABC-type lipoprotein export system ATPase subunit